MSMFEKATRRKYRFESHVGILSTEDLWDLQLTGRLSLNEVAKALHEKLESAAAVNFVAEGEDPEAWILRDKLELVKHIIKTRLAERDAEKKFAQRRERKQKLMEILHEKQDSSLREHSMDELQKMIEDL